MAAGIMALGCPAMKKDQAKVLVPFTAISAGDEMLVCFALQGIRKSPVQIVRAVAMPFKTI